jgi:hypothetical protein
MEVYEVRTDDPVGDFQPGLTYPDAVEFDVPKDAEGFVFVGTDGTLSIPIEIE